MRSTRRPARKTALQLATDATRKAISALLPGVTGVTVSSSYGYDVATATDTVITVVTYAAGTAYERLTNRFSAEALRVSAGETALTVIRAR